MKVLVTGAAGFIGFHATKCLHAAGHTLVGIDNLNAYYDVRLKDARLAQLLPLPHFSFHKLDLADRAGMESLFRTEGFDLVLHLGAQAGVRYSLDNPHAYLDSNLAGTLNVLEGCRQHRIGHLIYASSSSVYGGNTKLPFSIHDKVDAPVSLYAATKRANELMCHSYAHLYRIPCTGLRFFTVYGPWGRPDMAYYKFADAIMAGRPIDVYNHGDMKRDFTYIDDVVNCIETITSREPTGLRDSVPHRLYNLGNSAPEPLTALIKALENNLGRRAQLRLLPMQDGDVQATYADIAETTQDFGFAPKTALAVGISRFTHWYQTQKSL